jgi:hypothetical protein
MNPKIYLVGGAVRDKLLNRESNDRDYVVVGATPDWMESMGYTKVGASFPVYLHPKTGEEYALARQERKTGPGYHGFEVEYDSSVTLEEDLLRRDLTINAMAMDENGKIYDPFGGLHDLDQGILRHTSDAFADDPLRVLRLARFAARYQFKVADDTMHLAKKLVSSNELHHLPRERVWMELFKGLKEPNPAIMIKVLHDVGALDDKPVMDYFPQTETWSVMDNISWAEVVFLDALRKNVEISPEVKYLLLTNMLGSDHNPNLCIPSSYSKMSKRYHIIGNYLITERGVTPEEMFDLIESTKYLQEMNSQDMADVIEALHHEESCGSKSKFLDNFKFLNLAVFYIKQIDMKSVAEGDKSTIKNRVAAAKLEAIKRAFESMEKE